MSWAPEHRPRWFTASRPTRHEELTHRAVAKFLAYHPRFSNHWFHPPNERASRVQRLILSGLGVKPGLPDIWIVTPSALWPGAVFELKADRPNHSAPTRDQLRWLRLMEAVGWYAGLCIGVDEALSAINAYDAGNVADKPWHRYRVSPRLPRLKPVDKSVGKSV